jgi:hypothetical protein
MAINDTRINDVAVQNGATIKIYVTNEQIAKAMLNIVEFMQSSPNSGLQRQLQGADRIAMVERLAAAMADNPIAHGVLCHPDAVTNITELASTVETLREIAQELQAQVKHSDATIARLRSEIEAQEQTIQRQAQASTNWHVAADVLNELLAGTPEASLQESLLERMCALVKRYKGQESARDYVASIP